MIETDELQFLETSNGFPVGHDLQRVSDTLVEMARQTSVSLNEVVESLERLREVLNLEALQTVCDSPERP